MHLKKIYLVFIFCYFNSFILKSLLLGSPYLPYFNNPIGVNIYTYTRANQFWSAPNRGYYGFYVNSISQANLLIVAVGCGSLYVQGGSIGKSYIAGNTHENGSVKIMY